MILSNFTNFIVIYTICDIEHTIKSTRSVDIEQFLYLTKSFTTFDLLTSHIVTFSMDNTAILIPIIIPTAFMISLLQQFFHKTTLELWKPLAKLSLIKLASMLSKWHVLQNPNTSWIYNNLVPLLASWIIEHATSKVRLEPITGANPSWIQTCNSKVRFHQSQLPIQPVLAWMNINGFVQLEVFAVLISWQSVPVCTLLAVTKTTHILHAHKQGTAWAWHYQQQFLHTCHGWKVI